MTYLVTGGSGFIGSHLIERLLNMGHNVINVDNFDDYYDYKIKISNTLESLGESAEFSFKNKTEDLSALKGHVNSERYQLYTCDIRNKEELSHVFKNHPIDIVVHLAALAGVRPSIEDPISYAHTNIIGSLNLWELCKEYGVSKVVNASSSSVYGNNQKVPFSESDNVDTPISPYAATKKSGEILSHVYYKLYGMSMIHLRFFTVYGPRQRPDLAIHKFTSLIHSGAPVPFYGDGTTSRDYTYIEDIIEGILKALDYIAQEKHVFEIINLGESQTVSLKEMLSTIESALGQSAETLPLPIPKGDVNRTNADISKAKRILKYAPGTKFQNGIKIFVEWFLKKSGQVPQDN